MEDPCFNLNSVTNFLATLRCDRKKAVPALIELMDSSCRIQANVLYLFGSFGPDAQAALPRLRLFAKELLAAQDPDPIELEVALALNAIAPEETVEQVAPLLINSLKRQRPDIGQAMWLLQKVPGGPGRMVPVFVDMLESPDVKVQVVAVRALRELGADAEPLLPRLRALAKEFNEDAGIETELDKLHALAAAAVKEIEQAIAAPPHLPPPRMIDSR